MGTRYLLLPCGHYSLELAPFGYAAALRMGLFLFRNLDCLDSRAFLITLR